jgi:hypothetical protein
LKKFICVTTRQIVLLDRVKPKVCGPKTREGTHEACVDNGIVLVSRRFNEARAF